MSLFPLHPRVTLAQLHEQVLASLASPAAPAAAAALGLIETQEIYHGPWDQANLQPAGMEIAAAQTLLYLLANDLGSARMLRKRLGGATSADPLLTALWAQDVAGFFPAARALQPLLGPSPVLGPLLAQLVDRQRAEQKALCEAAYASLSQPSALQLLGLGSAAELEHFCRRSGWTVCPDGFIEPRAADGGARLRGERDMSGQMRRLVEQAVFLENEIGTHISNKPAAHSASG